MHKIVFRYSLPSFVSNNDNALKSKRKSIWPEIVTHSKKRSHYTLFEVSCNEKRATKLAPVFHLVLKVLSSEMDLAEIRFIRMTFIKEPRGGLEKSAHPLSCFQIQQRCNLS